MIMFELIVISFFFVRTRTCFIKFGKLMNHKSKIAYLLNKFIEERFNDCGTSQHYFFTEKDYMFVFYFSPHVTAWSCNIRRLGSGFVFDKVDSLTDLSQKNWKDRDKSIFFILNTLCLCVLVWPKHDKWIGETILIARRNVTTLGPVYKLTYWTLFF